MWNPYVLSKPVGTLHGHVSSISKIAINNAESQIISFSEDQNIRIWSAQNLVCLQSIDARGLSPSSENKIGYMFFDPLSPKLMFGSNQVEIYPVSFLLILKLATQLLQLEVLTYWLFFCMTDEHQSPNYGNKESRCASNGCHLQQQLLSSCQWVRTRRH